ncbi:protein CHUP1, chloroplastic isoform X2 [Humulus lupulus]|uniref:protein CHUP1, chloroplastic isoform X2 n=1 Tax=Humulus lupulus TaxID=3486 RepID=UPI002B40A5DB|nr:protein CHUP1, chloroplastic isoform X2 [Humulus lupulus]
MKLKEKGDMKPLMLKFGLALALSFAGFIYSRLRTRRIKPALPPPPSPRSGKAGRDKFHSKATRPNSYGLVSVTSEKYEESYMQKSLAEISHSTKLSGDRDGFVLPQFYEIEKDFNSATATAGISPDGDVNSTSSELETPKAFITLEKGEYEQEISHLQNMVIILRERERNLEVQLLEYYGLKEQETTVMELQNRLKINNMEAKLFNLKIESLLAENQRLEAQVAGQAKVMAELEAARAKIKLLKKKLRYEAEQNREQILKLQRSVAKMQDEEYKTFSSNTDAELHLKRLKDLEDEAEELRKSNLALRLENSELARRLESTQIIANSVLEDPETDALKEESERLRQGNKELQQEIEQLKADRCTDIEELVYLRWINACLRYELRNYQPTAGKTGAKDLSRTLSPKSEEKAKQLILDYANTEGIGEKTINLMDFDSDQWSSSQASFTDSIELDESSFDNTAAAKTNFSKKKKFFTKLRKLVMGKDSSHHNNHVSSADKFESVEESDSNALTRAYGAVENNNRYRTPTPNLSRHSLDLHKLKSQKKEQDVDIERVQRKSDGGSSYVYKSFLLGGEVDLDLTARDQTDKHSDNSTDKSELVKYAEALKRARYGTRKSHRRSSSYSSL